jgi:hypothetical protein
MADLSEYDRKAIIEALRRVRSLDRHQISGLTGIPPTRLQSNLAAMLLEGLIAERLVRDVPRLCLTDAGKAARR